VIVTGEPVSPVAVAVSVFVPAVVPRVQDVRAAMPEAFVATLDVGFRVPSPLNDTDVAETGLPPESVTITDGAVATAVFTVAVWLLPAFTAIVVAAPTVTVTEAVTGVNAPRE
jgi:hypothetical protein